MSCFNRQRHLRHTRADCSKILFWWLLLLFHFSCSSPHKSTHLPKSRETCSLSVFWFITLQAQQEAVPAAPPHLPEDWGLSYTSHSFSSEREAHTPLKDGCFTDSLQSPLQTHSARTRGGSAPSPSGGSESSPFRSFDVIVEVSRDTQHRADLDTESAVRHTETLQSNDWNVGKLCVSWRTHTALALQPEVIKPSDMKLCGVCVHYETHGVQLVLCRHLGSYQYWPKRYRYQISTSYKYPSLIEKRTWNKIVMGMILNMFFFGIPSSLVFVYWSKSVSY